jgi:hypothetical protein
VIAAQAIRTNLAVSKILYTIVFTGTIIKPKSILSKEMN